MAKTRAIAEDIEPRTVIEGAGVRLRRSFAPDISNRFDPFLLFDHFAFNDPIEGPLVGFPMHPHRGIETVTYMLEGSVHHRDSLGNSGRIGPGDVQWMTSGRGILHEEMPRRSPEGMVNGFQLWVNLPAALKMSAPRYQEIRAADIPALDRLGARVRLVAGRFDGVSGVVTGIAAHPYYMDVALARGRTFELPVPLDHTVFLYLFEGEVVVEGGRAAATRMLLLEKGDRVAVRESAGAQARFMLAAGAPFAEPIAPYGPFVMNTPAEIQQALADLRNGTFVQANAPPAQADAPPVPP
jgi:hypothetical protein